MCAGEANRWAAHRLVGPIQVIDCTRPLAGLGSGAMVSPMGLHNPFGVQSDTGRQMGFAVS